MTNTEKLLTEVEGRLERAPDECPCFLAAKDYTVAAETFYNAARTDIERLASMVKVARAALQGIGNNSGQENGCAAGCGATATQALAEINRLAGGA
jgi:hypothetical protein